MKFLKSRIFWLLALSVAGFGISYALLHTYELGICFADFETNTFDVSCHQDLGFIGVKLYYPSLALALVFLVLLVVPKAVSAWKKFAIWYVPITALLIATAKPQISGSGIGVAPTNIGPSFEESLLLVSALYLIISFLIVGRVVFQQKRNRTKT